MLVVIVKRTLCSCVACASSAVVNAYLCMCRRACPYVCMCEHSYIYVYMWLYAKLYLHSCCSHCGLTLLMLHQRRMSRNFTRHCQQWPNTCSLLLLFSLFLLFSQVRFFINFFPYSLLLLCGSLFTRRYSQIFTAFSNNFALYWVVWFLYGHWLNIRMIRVVPYC